MTLKFEASKKTVIPFKLPFVYPSSISLETVKHIILEIGPGRGEFLFHLAKTNPDAVIAAVELKDDRVDQLIKHIENYELKNVLLIQDDARIALPRDFKDSSVDEIHIQFPDPWPKRKHEHNRPVNLHLLKECARILKKNAPVTIITDDEDYSKYIEKNARLVSDLAVVLERQIVEDMNAAFPTYFAKKWKKQGKNFYLQKYKK